MDSRTFYDQYVERQVRVGVNARHRSILNFLLRFGMKGDSRVLEIGSGVGTVTGLIADTLTSQGSLVGADLSPKSIAAAQEAVGRRANVDLRAGDVLEMGFGSEFDVVVLPDVIEHIPLTLHKELFDKVGAWVKPSGFVLAHYPNPLWLAWCHDHRPDLLQSIDQPIHADLLTSHAYGAGLYLDYLETYSLWVAEGDYQVVVLKRMPSDPSFTITPERPAGALARVFRYVRRLVG